MLSYLSRLICLVKPHKFGASKVSPEFGHSYTKRCKRCNIYSQSHNYNEILFRDKEEWLSKLKEEAIAFYKKMEQVSAKRVDQWKNLAV